MILQGDCLEQLKMLDADTVDMCVTSPPYYALRDYGIDGQLGLEDTVDTYITKLCDVFDEVARVLKPEGTCWVNIGDTYAGAGGDWNKGARADQPKWKQESHTVASKSLIGVPFIFTLEMLQRGWILRNTIIWHKPSCMPSSAKDRFTVDFEYLFFFARTQKYYFNTQYEPYATTDVSGKMPPIGGKKHKGKHNATYSGNTPEWNYRKNRGYPGSPDKTGFPVEHSEAGRIKRAVWSINPARYKEAHFAVFPPELIKTPIEAGCPERGIVLDPFFGSGTTGLVAKQLNRNYIGIELNPEYVEIAKQRLAQTNIFDFI